MFPPSFEYHRASSVSEALSLLEEFPNATLLAGGHALIPRLKNGRGSPEAVVDVSEIPDLAGVEFGRNTIEIGAATTYSDVLETSGGTETDSGAGGGGIDEYAPAFTAATRAIGDRQIRNRGTVGGNLVEAHPDADLPAGALVAEASVRIRGPDGDRTVAIGEFFTGSFETVVDDTELVTEIRLPRREGIGGAYVKKTHPASGYAMIGVAARVAVEDGRLASVRIAANGVADTPVRLSSVERALRDVNADSGIERVGTVAEQSIDVEADVPETDRRGDVHASADYRVSVLPTYVKRAVRAAVNDVGSEGVGPEGVGPEGVGPEGVGPKANDVTSNGDGDALGGAENE